MWWYRRDRTSSLLVKLADLKSLVFKEAFDGTLKRDSASHHSSVHAEGLKVTKKTCIKYTCITTVLVMLSSTQINPYSLGLGEVIPSSILICLAGFVVP